MSTTINVQKKKRRQELIAITPAGRKLLERVMAEGRHGTLQNTVEVALETHQKFLRGELQVKHNPAELASAS